MENERILLTGGHGFLGRHLHEQLTKLCPTISVPNHAVLDLLDRKNVDAYIEVFQPTIVIHAAGVCANIIQNKTRPAEFIHDNAVMGFNLLDACHKAGVTKFVNVGTVCSYPDKAPIPFKEEDLWEGKPEETNSAYGLGKRIVAGACEYYRQQYGFNAVTIILANLYGPYDHFGRVGAHVIPQMIDKFFDAKAKGESVYLFGTGHAAREFLYAEDAAFAILKVCQSDNKSGLYNFGSGYEITIGDLAEQIQKLTGHSGHIRWEIDKPIGQKRRRLDCSRFLSEFGTFDMTRIMEGLEETIQSCRAPLTEK